MKKIIASLLAVLLVSSTISPAVAANIADVKSSIAFSKIERFCYICIFSRYDYIQFDSGRCSSGSDYESESFR